MWARVAVAYRCFDCRGGGRCAVGRSDLGRGVVEWARRVKYKFVLFVYPEEDDVFAFESSPFPSFGADSDNRVTI